MISARFLPSLSPLAPFDVHDYVGLHKPCLDVRRFRSIPLDGNRKWMYDERHGVDRLSEVGGWVKRWMHRGGRGAVLRGDKATYLDIPFIRCTEEEVYESRLARTVRHNPDLRDTDLVVHSLEYFAFSRLYDTLQHLTSSEYLLKDINFESLFRVRPGSKPFCNWHCVHIFGIPTGQRDELFVKVPSWWGDFEESRLLFVPTPIVFAYHATLAIDKRRRALLFCIAIVEHCVYCLMSFLTSALPGGPVNSVPVSGGAQELAESGMLLPLPKGVHEYVSDAGLFWVIRGTQFDYAQAYLAYHRSLEVDREDEVVVGWFPDVSACGGVLDVPARENTSSKRSADDIRMKRWVVAVPVKFKVGPRKTLKETQEAVSFFVGSSSGAQDHAEDVPIVEKEDIIEEDAPVPLTVSLSGCSSLKRVPGVSCSCVPRIAKKLRT